MSYKFLRINSLSKSTDQSWGEWGGNVPDLPGGAMGTVKDHPLHRLMKKMYSMILGKQIPAEVIKFEKT